MLQILIIDDDKNIRRYLKTILLAAGYTPICTETANEALHQVRKSDHLANPFVSHHR